MGRGKKWSSEERERVAIAWSRATHDPVVGHNQSGDTFDEKVYSLFSQKPPKMQILVLTMIIATPL